MKPAKTKAEIRAEMDQQVESFLEGGGSITSVPRGISGNTDNKNLFTQASENPPRQERTSLTHVVKTLEERKHTKGNKPLNDKSSKPKKVLITDDFGEPVRWVWVEE